MSYGLTKPHGLTEMLTGPIVTSDVVIHYVLSKFTKLYGLKVVLMFPYLSYF